MFIAIDFTPSRREKNGSPSQGIWICTHLELQKYEMYLPKGWHAHYPHASRHFPSFLKATSYEPPPHV